MCAAGEGVNDGASVGGIGNTAMSNTRGEYDEIANRPSSSVAALPTTCANSIRLSFKSKSTYEIKPTRSI